MITSHRPAASLRCRILVLTAGLWPAVSFAQSASAPNPPVRLQIIKSYELAPVVVTATRTANDPVEVGTAVDSLAEQELARRQQDTLAAALGGIPGAPLVASGSTGATASLFLRGANSNQTLFLVDGIRLSDANADYAVFLGGSTLGGYDTIEVARGPQSTLYGGEAIGGVVAINTLHGGKAAQQRVSTGGGSFGTIRGSLSTSGAAAKWNYLLNLNGGRTENVRANNRFGTAGGNLGVDRSINDSVRVGATARWFHSEYGDPGDRFTNDSDDSQRENNTLVTFFADAQPAPGWSVHAIAGGQDRRLVSDASFGNGFPNRNAVTTNRRGVLDLQATYTGHDRHRFTIGTTGESTHTRNTGFGAIDRRQQSLAFFAQDEFRPTETLHLTAGLRRDDFDTFGLATTGRLTAAWQVAPRQIKLRASYGTGFRSPSFLDLYGQSFFYVGNPALRPERARGWDAGLDFYRLPFGGTTSLTWFENRFSDLITGDFTQFPSSVANIARARTRGIELSSQLHLTEVLDARLSYTYLDASNLSGGTRLLRRPRHSGSADLWHDFRHGVSAGAGVSFATDRRDIDASTFATIDGENFTVARLYGAYELRRGLTLKVRIENLLNERYEPVNSYPAPGFGAFGGIEWRW